MGLNVRISRFSYPKAIWLLALGMTINVMGNSFLWPLNTIYITTVLQRSVSIAGLVLMLQQGTGVLGNLIGGWIFDHWGAKKGLIFGILVSIGSVFSLTFVNNLIPYVILMLLIGFGNGFVFPSMYAMAGAVWPEGGRKAFNTIYVAQNLGVALGPALGGVIFEFSFRYIFIGNALMYLLFLTLILFGFNKEIWELSEANSIKKSNVVIENSDLTNQKGSSFFALMILSFAFILSWMPYSQWTTSFSVYINSLGIPYSKYTLLWTINGALIVLGQPLIALVTKNLLKTTKQQILVGVTIFIVGFSILLNNTIYLGFAISMAVMTIGEMLLWPAVPAAAADLAPKEKKGFYQGVISSSAAGGRMLGFLIGSWLFDFIGMNPLVLIMLGLLVVSGISFYNYDRFTNFRESNIYKRSY
ncbi:hypothetical protein BHF71_02350 [Vulcanibacillus modesticaldus]|uniref:Major facilitator superfamily (MFS) profile domain-containing protein n=1 Tax=Vulcanibacillus modesticaldus TaxID=337097 RepID=A0A1D2YTP6_9BACI|nr:MFS transporter [Vulcanibacillus modesticaldus]OEF99046.1 hypothetical protein BHF71_02350 [Vulcanibacillus modesticaldus]